MDDDWLAVRRNIRKVLQVWIRLGKLLQREGVGPFVSEKFYQEVVQVVLLFGEDTWVFLVALTRMLEGVHMVFLWKVTVKTER